MTTQKSAKKAVKRKPVVPKVEAEATPSVAVHVPRNRPLENVQRLIPGHTSFTLAWAALCVFIGASAVLVYVAFH